MKKQKNISKLAVIIALALFASIVCVLIYYAYQWKSDRKAQNFTDARTFFGIKREIGEPFGIAEKDGDIFVSDGENGRILRISDTETFAVVTDQLNTPSAIAFDQNEDLIVADSGAHAIKRVKIDSGEIELIAGIEGEKGFADGDANSAKFNAPIGIAIGANGKIYVADTYNDKIRIIENGRVSTLAGNDEGFSDGVGISAKFDTPCGIAVTNDGKLLVADSGNSRIRVVDESGKTWTLAGQDRQELTDGLLNQASFVQPTAISINYLGTIYVADGNAIRVIGRRTVPLVETLTGKTAGFSDGNLLASKFNRPSGLAFSKTGNLYVSDSDNQVVRVLTAGDLGTEITKEEIAALRYSPDEFRQLSEPRWTYEPPDKAREIAGTLGEIRGEIGDGESQSWFHNGLDIVGGYGERAKFIRSEKILNPLAVQNFATLRELIRMPTLGYVHIRIGRNVNSGVFDDSRFQFSVNDQNQMAGLRVPRGTKFNAGETIGTLNPMNHVHLVAGRRGNEMNALDALVLPGIVDSRTPTIEKVSLFDENWNELDSENSPIKLTAKTRIVVKAYDQMDGNADRRRLGVYKLGYQVLKKDNSPVTDLQWTINFDRFPTDEAVSFAYAKGSKSGATGETVFNYIVSNNVNGDGFSEGFLDISSLENGIYILRIQAVDFFKNLASSDLGFVVEKQTN